MKLPKIDKPLFDLPMPSKGKSYLSRPFLVKEEKILLMAQQSGEDKDIILAIKQILENCIQDPEFNSKDLATFDIEYMFLKLRAKSVNNVIKVSYVDNEDQNTYDFEIDLDNVEMLQESKVDKNIKLTDTVGIIMKYPSVDIINGLKDDMSPVEVVEYLIRNCIDIIYDEETVYPAGESSADELDEFINSLDIDSFNKIKEFFDSMPKMHYEIKYVNEKGSERTIVLSALSDFFTWE